MATARSAHPTSAGVTATFLSDRAFAGRVRRFPEADDGVRPA